MKNAVPIALFLSVFFHIIIIYSAGNYFDGLKPSKKTKVSYTVPGYLQLFGTGEPEISLNSGYEIPEGGIVSSTENIPDEVKPNITDSEKASTEDVISEVPLLMGNIEIEVIQHENEVLLHLDTPDDMIISDNADVLKDAVVLDSLAGEINIKQAIDAHIADAQEMPEVLADNPEQNDNSVVKEVSVTQEIQGVGIKDENLVTEIQNKSQKKLVSEPDKQSNAVKKEAKKVSKNVTVDVKLKETFVSDRLKGQVEFHGKGRHIVYVAPAPAFKLSSNAVANVSFKIDKYGKPYDIISAPSTREVELIVTEFIKKMRFNAVLYDEGDAATVNIILNVR